MWDVGRCGGDRSLRQKKRVLLPETERSLISPNTFVFPDIRAVVDVSNSRSLVLQ